MRYQLLLASLLAILSTRTLGAEPRATVISWQKLGEDLEIAKLDTTSMVFFSNELTFVRSSLKHFKLSVLRAAEFGQAKANVKFLCTQSRASVCINANFFDERGRALGLVMNRGVTHQSIHQGGELLNGVFAATRERLSIVVRESFNPSSVLEAVQSGPIILKDGKPLTDNSSSSRYSRRSGVCLDGQGRLVFYAVSRGFFGLSIAQLREVLLRPEINCRDALNLDGGGSSQIYISNDIPGGISGARDFFSSGEDDIPVALALLPAD